MVKIKSGGQAEKQEISNLRIQRQFSRLEQAYSDLEKRNIQLMSADTGADGDLSPLMLWGEE